MTNAIKVLLQMTSSSLQLESTVEFVIIFTIKFNKVLLDE
jgi:hypothetical protein